MIISYIQTATNYIYHPLHEKFVEISQTADWKEKTMLAGLIVSVCCAVITFFTQTVFICGAFAMLSGVCSLGTLYIRHYENLKKMSEHISKLQTENETFEENNKRLEKSVAEQTNSVTHLTFENEKLKTEVSKLNIHTDHLKQTSQDLIGSVEDLRVHLVALNPMVAETQETERKLSTFSITMENQQKVSKRLMEVISEASAERSNQLESEKEILRQLQALQNNDTTLQKIKELNHLQQQISGSHEKLANVIKDYTDFQIKAVQASTALSGLQEQYSLENTRLQETRQELSEVSSGLRSLLAEQRDDKSALKLQIDRLQSLYVGLNLHNSTVSNGLD